MGKIATGSTLTNGQAYAPTDWEALKAEILSKLNIATEYALLGIEFTKPSANRKGLLECRAMRTDDNRDDVPSAFVNVETGVYHDSGNGGLTLSFFNFALQFGSFGRWIDVIKHYAARAGVEMGSARVGQGGRIRESVYLYREADGATRYAVFRYRLPNGKKSFSQHPPNKHGGWESGAGCMETVPPLPYRLPEMLAARPDQAVFVVEGEKDADRLGSLGLVASTGHGGCGYTNHIWPKIAEAFHGRPCVIIPDNDVGGRAHARKVASYLKPFARSVKVVSLPGLPAKGDVSDWLDLGNTVAELEQLAAEAPEWDPEADKAEQANAADPEVETDEQTPWDEPILDAKLPVADFPVEVFPGPMADFVIETADCLTCPADYVGVACLVVASGAIGRSVSIKLKDGWIESAALYAAVVGDAGMTKSPSIGCASRPLWKITDELIRDHKVVAERARQDKEDPPSLTRIAIDDATVEALATTLADNPRGLVMVRDELTAWVAGLNQYKGGKGADRQFFLSAWSGSPVVVDRKRNEGVPLHIPHPFLSVVGALTPSMLTELSEAKNRDDGFLDRLLFALPAPVQVRWRPDGIHDEHVLAWEYAVRRLWGRSMTLGPEGRLRPYLALMTPDASALFGEWFNAHCLETEQPDFPAHLKGAWAKMRAYCGRLALVLTMLSVAYDPTYEGQNPVIDMVAVQDAIILLNYFKNHARRVRSLLRGAGADNDDARAILLWCHRTKRSTFSERDAKQNFDARFASDNQALANALDWLKARKCVRPVSSPAPQKGRPGSPRYEVNPAILNGVFKPPAEQAEDS